MQKLRSAGSIAHNRQLFITESHSGAILVADLEQPGVALPRRAAPD